MALGLLTHSSLNFPLHLAFQQISQCDVDASSNVNVFFLNVTSLGFASKILKYLNHSFTPVIFSTL